MQNLIPRISDPKLIIVYGQFCDSFTPIQNPRLNAIRAVTTYRMPKLLFFGIGINRREKVIYIDAQIAEKIIRAYKL